MRGTNVLARYAPTCLGVAEAPKLTSIKGALFYPIGILNILTDLALVTTPIFVLWNVQLPLSTRSLVMGAFISRGL